MSYLILILFFNLFISYCGLVGVVYLFEGWKKYRMGTYEMTPKVTLGLLLTIQVKEKTRVENMHN